MQSTKKKRPAQTQAKPGKESRLKPVPETLPLQYPNGKLYNKVALITGADSGIGRATALLFAKEGAIVVVNYLSEDQDAKETWQMVKDLGGECLLIKKDISKEKNCEALVKKVIDTYGKIDILINNAATQTEKEDIEEISTQQLMKTFHTNFFSMFWITQLAIPHMKKGSSIINTTSVTAYRGSNHLIDYAATKGAILSFTRALANNFAKNKKGIRVNAVAPGPIWTPLIASSFNAKKVSEFGSDTPLERAGQPNEVAPCYLFLASDDASFIHGQVIHPNGGEMIGS